MATNTSEAPVRVTSIPDESNENARLRPAYASFGDEGVTATTNAHGHLLQIARYLGNGQSGFYCVDLPNTPPPNSAQRLGKFESWYDKSDVGIRLRIEDSEGQKNWLVDSKTPTMKFIHDRWPLFVTETPAFDLEIQYIVHDKTVYQTYTFKLKEGFNVENMPIFSIDANLLIRNLNFVKSNNENARGCADKSYSYCEAHENSRIIRKHGSLQMGITGNGAVGLVIMPFINERHYRIEGSENSGLHKIYPGDEELQHLKSCGEMVVTIAYTLESMESGEASVSSNTMSSLSKATQDPSQAAKDLSAAKCKMDMKIETFSFTKEKHLNFILRRNLEHILSVCSIPTRDASDDTIVPIALTCGDIASHRVITASSFYAFEFLLLALTHLQRLKRTCPCDQKNEPCGDYKCRMLRRIQRTCQGHLLWIYQITEKPYGNLCSHYWATGKMIKNPENNSSLAKKSILDIPFHIIKAQGFCHIIPDLDIRQPIIDGYKSIFKHWIQDLHKSNKNSEYVFPRSMEKSVHKFYIAEQAIIWCALKSGEKLGFCSKLHIGKKLMSYSALDIQKSVLNKFTHEDSPLDKPMVAISRSSHGKTFKLRTQDTAIFYPGANEIFTTSEESGTGQSKMEEYWINTLDHQMVSAENMEASWSDPLQFALAILISAKSKSESSNLKAIHKLAKDVLLQSSSPNGLLTGQFNEDKEPTIPTDLSKYHSYWHATFEIPYILWMHGMDLPDIDKAVSEHSSSATTPTFASESDGLSKQSAVQNNSKTKNRQKEKFVDYYDEWLYSSPRFLTFQVDLREEATEKFYEQITSKELGTVINKALKKIRQNNRAYSIKPEFSANLSKGYIISAPEVTSSTDINDMEPYHILSNNELRLKIDPRILQELEIYYDHLFREFRSSAVLSTTGTHSLSPSGVSNNTDDTLASIESDIYPLPVPIRKKLMHFYQMDFELAMTCYHASSEAEDLSLFLDRHASYDKYFYEDAQLIFNKWTTELHLSFYQVLSDDSTAPIGISQPRNIKFPSFRKGDKPQSIGRVSLSLRFDGDLFDNNWICYFIEYNPQQMSKKDKVQPLSEKLSIGSATKKVEWQERRILELLILDKMLDEILRSSKNVLREIQHSILENSQKRGNIYNRNQQEAAIDYDTGMLLAEFEIFDKTPTDVFLSIQSAWHKFRRITDIVEEDLQENITTIKLWMKREKKRHDRPRWPESSVHKHEWTISQLSAMNDRKFDELQRCYDSIKAFNVSLGKRMEAARNKWEIQGSNDIRLFTYVTVVFLPISFATSVFSMNDAPSGNTLRHMIIIAAAALGVTIIALFNAKTLDSKLVRPIYRSCRYVLKGSFFIMYHLVVLPCIFLIARYIYCPASLDGSPQQRSDEPGSFAVKVGELLHKFDNPISQARKDIDEAKDRRKADQKQGSENQDVEQGRRINE